MAEGRQRLLTAYDLFQEAHQRALWRKLWRRLTGRRVAMQCLVGPGHAARASGGQATLRTVPIAQIRGSEGRCDEFDTDFNPLRWEDRRKWVALCDAWLSGAVLPPVQLIQLGDIYYVRDGHHRISVARALGQEQIEAEVVAWE